MRCPWVRVDILCHRPCRASGGVEYTSPACQAEHESQHNGRRRGDSVALDGRHAWALGHASTAGYDCRWDCSPWRCDLHHACNGRSRRYRGLESDQPCARIRCIEIRRRGFARIDAHAGISRRQDAEVPFMAGMCKNGATGIDDINVGSAQHRPSDRDLPSGQRRDLVQDDDRSIRQ